MKTLIIKKQTQFNFLPSKIENGTIIEIIGRLSKIDRQIDGAIIHICENARIGEICGSAKINYVCGSTKINFVCGSAIIDYVHGSAKIYNIHGSVEINHVHGSAKIYNVYGLTKIQSIYGSAEIFNVFGSAKINYYASISPMPKILENAQILKIEKTYHNPSNNQYYWDKEMMVPVLI